MKQTKIFLLLTLTTLASTGALASEFSGKYQVLKADCDSTGNLFAGDTDAIVEANVKEIRVGKIYYTGNGGPGSRPYFESSFQLSVGTQRENCLGDCYSLYEGAYSADGNEFKEVRMEANTMSAPPTYAGETDIKLLGDTLEIETTDNGQFTPGPLSVCLLKKLQ